MRGARGAWRGTGGRAVRSAERERFTRVPPCCQQLLSLLTADPPVPYAQISTRLGIPIGGIVPNWGRCLDKLRRDSAIAALMMRRDSAIAALMNGMVA